VKVDPDTGTVQVIDLVSAQDVGHAINPSLCEGQMRGGAAQGVGWALFEELVHDESGQLITSSYLNYAIPRMESMPTVDTVIVEVPSRHGPFGAKGIGESAAAPGAAAIANAIAAATGCRMHELPMTAQRVWRAMNNKSAQPGG
jgi:CO/xanthine dehydrogenase Mo-binding subunit